MDDHGRPLYPARYREVLKFHPPGLAAAVGEDGAMHIRPDGLPAYAARYGRTFGFYEGRAAVDTGSGWTHIDDRGEPLYAARHAWCGNFQDERAPVRTAGGTYRHVDRAGEPIGEDWAYAGDFRDGIAVVQRADGRHTHVDRDGHVLHGRWFADLDVFHKGFARARDDRGWVHVDRGGRPAYARRFGAVEPFYNGQARVERFDGGLEIVDEAGRTVHVLRDGPDRALAALSADIVGYWRTRVIEAVVEVGLVEALPAPVSDVASRSGLAPDSASRLLRAAWALGLAAPAGKAWRTTARGDLLRRGRGMDAATRLWAGDHARRWESLVPALRGRGPAGRAGERGSFFDELPAREHASYHAALRAYARDDYAGLADTYDWSEHRRVLDAGGATGGLLVPLLQRQPHLDGILLDLPEIVALAEIPSSVGDRVRPMGVDLFEPWPATGDVVVLARVLHDWPDEQAILLLRRAAEALAPGGRLLVLEMVLSEHDPDGALLDLNMLVTTGGRERDLHGFDTLFGRAGLQRVAVHELRPWVAILVVERAR